VKDGLYSHRACPFLLSSLKAWTKPCEKLLNMAKEDEKSECPDNYVIPGPELPNGDRLCISHHDGHNNDVGVITKIEPGKPIPDHARMVSPIEGTPFYELGESIAEMKSGSKGPAKVSSKAYRNGYDKIFGKRNKSYN
jgi:hypothetical protein